MSSVRAATLVAALSFSLVRGGVPRSWKSPWPGCDNGKVGLQSMFPVLFIFHKGRQAMQ